MLFPYKTADISSKPVEPFAGDTPVSVWHLRNRNGMRAEILTYGGAIGRLVATGGDLRKHDVALATQHDWGALLQAALRSEAAPALPVMDASQQDRHVAMTRSDGEGNRLELRFALTDDNELAIGKTLTLAQSGANDAAGALEGMGDSPLASAWALPLYMNLAGQEPGNVLDHAFCVDGDSCISLDGEQGPARDMRRIARRCALAQKPLGSAGGAPCDPESFQRGMALADRVLAVECLGGPAAGFHLMFESKKKGVHPWASAYCSRSKMYVDIAADAPMLGVTTFQPGEGVPVPGKGTHVYGNHSGVAFTPYAKARTLNDGGFELSYTEVLRFTPDFPEDYRPDSGCLDRII